MFQVLGMDARTEFVYRLVLERPELTLDEIVLRLGWPETEVRDALDRLAELCLLDRDGVQGPDEEPPVFRALDPAASLPFLLSRREAELARQQRSLELVRDAVSALAAHQDRPAARGYDVIKRLEGLDEVRERLTELAELARTECLSLLPGGAQAPDTLAASKPLDRQALERGVRVRSIYQDSFRNDPGTLRYVNWLGELGAESRTLPALPLIMVVVDREVALVPLDPDDPRAGALELRSRGAVAVAHLLFEEYWAAATPLGRIPPRGPHGLTPQEDELLSLLAKGHTDATAARRLGVSLRTVRRMNAELTARLEARSRFQAGAEAVRRGWV
ncbi:LuxR C-terminal-related transcriptional regulator [Streptomyces sp. BE308]|uniref:helix-turn-helix transcriptional regulator n=1 Tax=unclassified Streptomyces TaxID=2593676 RepID=UPI002DDBB074|nr:MULTISPECIES: LuxR C-terminal-related transcriptional regulator [unclassified Streptomyces]MEE1796988.1 LuxR C-terminal-related transcriptional regulator [Streptomyces sp. BE308]WRZ74972.1 LuxR C-terminal-related transcriptional regulator [Streptomyces sp. NBC_01237]